MYVCTKLNIVRTVAVNGFKIVHKLDDTLHTPTVHFNISSFIITEVEGFNEEYVTVVLKRIPGGNLLNYSASTIPHLDIWFTETGTNKLRVNYNINYSVGVAAVLCNSVVATVYLHFNYGENDADISV